MRRLCLYVAPGVPNKTPVSQNPRVLKNKGYAGEMNFEIYSFVKRYPDELVPDALKLAAAVGRYLRNMFEA